MSVSPRPTSRPSALPLPAPRSLRASNAGSALVLVLLVVALLTTTVVGFLSTARIEQLAARNFSQQNAAAGLAELATQQAMAKIQNGFTVNGNSTTVITTQPGAIRQFQFSGGNCTLVAEEELFSGTGNATTNGMANLNNLENPRDITINAPGGQWTITGNSDERINVPMDEVKISENGTERVIGRIAYYVDDEGSKLNVNNAVGNRTTLNAVIRPLDIAAFSANDTSIFASIVNGTASNNSSNVTTWSYFFRPDQVSAAINSVGGNFSLDNLPYITAATSSANSTANITHCLTPWGTQRIDINMLSTNATDGNGTESVRSIFEALTGLNGTTMNAPSNSIYGITGQGLQNIFGGNFSTKYTPVGVKQIAANMLQMRDPHTFSVDESFNYNGTILCDSLGFDPNPYNITQKYFGIPKNYFSNVPFPIINEIGCTIRYWHVAKDVGTPNQRQQVVFFVWLELYNPYENDYVNSTDAAIVFMLDKIQFKTNSTGNTTVGVYEDFREYQKTNQRARFYAAYGNQEADDPGIRLSPFRSEPIIKIPDIPARSTRTIRLECFTFWFNGNFPGIGTSSTRIIGDVTIGIERILLLANYASYGPWLLDQSNPLSIRDAISGNDIGDIIIPASDVVLGTYGVGSNYTASRLPGPDSITFKRLDARYKTIQNGTATGAFTLDGNTSITRNGSSYQDNIVPAPDSTSENVIPGDPILSNNSTYLLSSNLTEDKLQPVLNFPAFSSPADLGKVPTNTPYRSLRMQLQPAIEGARIPDWAILDVISFGNSSNSNLPYNRFQPVNINASKFHLPGNGTVAPRTIGIQSLVNGLTANGEIQNPMDLTQTAPVDVSRFKGNTANSTDIVNIVNAICDMTWSSNSSWGNSTSNATTFRRNALRFPENQYILPSEIMEIAGVADQIDQTDYNNSTSHFKRNEGRASALIPAITTRSSFFTIYAYAQALDTQGNVDSEALTRTLVEVEVETPATATDPAVYKVKKLYTQPISVP